MNQRRTSTFAFVVALVAAGVVGAAALALPGALPDLASGAEPEVERVTLARPTAGQRIDGSVGPGSAVGVDPGRVRPGRYTIVVRDRSSRHNWHITGPGGIDRKTRVGFRGTERFTVRLAEGRYRISCDPHSSRARTRLVVRGPG